MACLQANNLAKAYRGREVVRDVSLQVDSGQVVGLLGPNGAGKTTCFYMIIGIIQADRGVIELNGEDITPLSMHERARHGLGYLPQEASIFRKLTVGDNILAILETRPDLNKKQRLERRDQLLEEFHVEHLRDSLGQALSGGERRRIEIARALAAEPDFILLDEPFAGVDPISVNDIKTIINHLRDRGIGVLITDHNVRDTLDICEKAYIVGEGHIIASGTAEDVLGSEHVRRIYLGDQFQL
ncbi:MAG: LPS export ABC transporter ATP-binding protein [Halioglobus sp.]|uniref:Lipopolysaccharide ABC transporter ATP-binding protein n=1 Tax=Candidatus Seongchinamella marina TaxID=2518990 RepID=A0ABT3SS81_9GAMM|nr:LPS export ABC transporter ATP-binding protein [Candidatus Seongchinamella marina]EEB80552.1 ABC transporter, ATP-binding protein, putative [marine gamma proteobacterium HTCC2148]MBT3412234.1 LPS export ABC transporter ATP-binding protein [Halieaceae bacterium]MDG1388823.1 LPS export ABC transporter ATP-binding protein [Halioglobus sp.]MBT5005916.1 LPS export ABC transporter ATP-binding protein [Halieaceae bacterium]MBT6123879.1 LPS export ABC transporter ATP-binding protein [Halieaceae bac